MQEGPTAKLPASHPGNAGRERGTKAVRRKRQGLSREEFDNEMFAWIGIKLLRLDRHRERLARY